ncbi:MFS transporter [Lentzea sp. NEAU-D13]|uniref:MFS transporter n=1 Tax=Lentzea alba TaxID=2714351 RepID=A0A7C9RVZ3_9PSEU|nr:MFS transporter [Lentzea alba]NGY63123.1 MFS transporter [Lentzea alba]
MSSVRERHVLFTHRDFRLLFSADTISQIGSQVVLLGLPLVALSALNATAFEVGLLAACGTLPLLVIGLFAGAWVDRVRRRMLMIVCDVLRAALLLTIPAAWWLDKLSMAQLYGVALGIGAAGVVFDIAYQSYLPQLINRDRLVEGNAALQTVQGVAQTTAPGFTGYVVHVFTAPFAMIAAVVGYLWSALCVRLMRTAEQAVAPDKDRHLFREIAEGLQFIVGDRVMRATVACSASMNLFSSISAPMLIVLLAKDLAVPASSMGLVFAATGIGGIVGGMLTTRLVAKLGQGRAIWISSGLTGLMAMSMPLAQPGGWLVLLAAALFVSALSHIVYNVSVLSFRQAVTPTRLLGRVAASGWVLRSGIMPLGNVLGGAFAAALGTRYVLWIAATGATFSFLWIYFSPMRTMRELPAEVS